VLARRPGLRPAALVISLALVVAACSSDGDGSSDATSSTRRTSSTTGAPTSTRAARTNVDGALVLGQLAPTTGSLASLSQSFVKPVQMAVDEMNLAGGVGGQPVRVAVADDGSTDVAIARASLRSLLDTTRADAILGPASSGTALALLDDVRDENVIQCSGSNFRSELSTADTGGRYFRTSPPDSLQGPALAQLVRRDGRTRPVLLVRNDSYGADLAGTTVRALRRAGTRTAGDPVTYDPSGSDADAKVAEALAREPGAVVVLGLADDGAKVVGALARAGAPPAKMPTYTVDGLQSSTFGAAVDPANPAVVAGIKGTAPAAAPAGIDNPFNAAFGATGVEPVYSAYTYDCAVLVALAAVRAGSDDPARMRRAFARNLRGKTDCSTFATCKAALDAGRSIHYRGASSRFDRWRGHEPGTGTYEVWYYDTAARVTNAPASEQISSPG
jgi:branched-chain amino acid transport system substrate-binding protein